MLRKTSRSHTYRKTKDNGKILCTVYRNNEEFPHKPMNASGLGQEILNYLCLRS